MHFSGENNSHSKNKKIKVTLKSVSYYTPAGKKIFFPVFSFTLQRSKSRKLNDHELNMTKDNHFFGDNALEIAPMQI